MVSIRLATFNCENLFARFKFKANVNPQNAIINGWLPDKTFFVINDEVSKRLTAKAIKASKADVIALQEVESHAALRRFRNKYLGGSNSYKYSILVDGNDPRLIDVAVLSKYPIERVDSHIHEWDDELNWFMFPRDCLECEIILPGNKSIRLFVNHFKSMLEKRDPCNGRRKTRDNRLHQSKKVKNIVLHEFAGGEGNFAILGDLNDYLETDQQGETGINDLVNWTKVENVINRKSPDERWTHFYDGNPQCGHPPSFKQLDYILLSKTLAENTDDEPEIIRNGLPKIADRYSGPWFEGVGQKKPKASDHCPVVMEIKI
jgi:endonuclease/exonuclease/phosphatase family metal-dependent hydrolase